MTQKNRRILVIDTNIVRAASAGITPTASACNAILNETLTLCHKVVLTQALDAEWRRHLSHVSTQWLRRMQSRRGKVVQLAGDAPATIARQLELAIGNAGVSEHEQAALRKDAHLVIAALATDRRILSLDDRARGVFQRVVAAYPALAPIMWVNPNTDSTCIEWLRQGAPDDAARHLA